MSYVERLRQIIATRGMTHKDLAERVGLTRATMSRILSGKQEPKLREAYEIARELGVTLNDLVDDHPPLDSPDGLLIRITHDDLCLLKVAHTLGVETAMARLINAAPPRRIVADPPPIIAR